MRTPWAFCLSFIISLVSANATLIKVVDNQELYQATVKAMQHSNNVKVMFVSLHSCSHGAHCHSHHHVKSYAGLMAKLKGADIVVHNDSSLKNVCAKDNWIYISANDPALQTEIQKRISRTKLEAQ